MERKLIGIVIAVALVAGAIGGYACTKLSQLPLSANPVNNGGPIFAVASSTGDIFFLVDSNGKVGVNSIHPNTDLDVTGLMRAWWAFVPPCTKDIEGSFTYDRITHHFTGCNGESWRILDN